MRKNQVFNIFLFVIGFIICIGIFNTCNGQTPIPGLIQAENFTASRGVAIENCLDSTAGLVRGKDVWNFDATDFVEYKINALLQGYYIVKYRVSASERGGFLQVRNGNDSIYRTVSIPPTWGPQTWETVTDTMFLYFGVQTFRISCINQVRFSLNWFNITFRKDTWLTATYALPNKPLYLFITIFTDGSFTTATKDSASAAAAMLK